MTTSRSEEWQRIRTLEDATALVVNAKQLALIARIQAWHEGDWATVYEVATELVETLDELSAFLSFHWHEMFKDEPPT